MTSATPTRLAAAALAGLAVLLTAGCWSRSPREVIVYTALDSDFSEPIFADFEASTGIKVLPKFDTESTKTVGLARALLAERDRPRCDVFWNNEILNTIRLQQQGLIEAYTRRSAKANGGIRSDDGAWQGLPLGRGFWSSYDLVSEADRPRSIHDLGDPKWRGRAAIAKPLFGTTATHAACLFAAWGDSKAQDYFLKLKKNGVQVLSGNKQVALSVAAGHAHFGLTDTDDAIIEVEKGRPVAIVYPDQGEGQVGTLFIPNTVAVIKNGPNPENARRLVDYLLSPAVEAKLAAGPSAQIPLNPAVQAEVRVETPKTIRAMEIDFAKAAARWEAAAGFIRLHFTGAD